jgi:hypothetical protein
LNVKKLLLALAVAAALYFSNGLRGTSPVSSTPPPDSAESSSRQAANTEAIAAAFAERRSDVQVSGEGKVIKLLKDDNEGSRHQRFLLEIPGGQTLLVAHNIDLAPRLDQLSPGDTVAFYGEYAWNAQGGVIHWTHHDPQGRHAAGWLRVNGKTYQ